MDLRRQISTQRLNLTDTELDRHALLVAKIIGRHKVFTKAKRIASFIAANGEQSPFYLNSLAWSLGKLLVIPKLKSFNTSLWFVEYADTDNMCLNKFNIPEPCHSKSISPWSLDLVLLPLMAFDKSGNRLGMGGGYYDKTFALNRSRSKRPMMIGLAHDFQQVKYLNPNPWDVPLDAVVTEKELIICK